ncbi:MAG TPA: hypothetical protein VGV89_03450 [Thermoplasmata archaeon]|nr:hypothetical protein [Thermoplasmata archaeon]
MGRPPLRRGHVIAPARPLFAVGLGVLAVALLGLPGGTATLHAPVGAPRIALHPDALTIVTSVFDRGNATYSFAGVTSRLADEVAIAPGTSGQRSYSIALTTSSSLPGLGVELTTLPFWEWSDPYQLPGGPDVLPEASHWNWVVTSRGHADTGNWSYNPSTGLLARPAPWANQSYVLTGWVNASVVVTVYSNTTDGTHSPQLGFTLNGGISAGPGSRSVETLESIAQGVSPGIIRFGISQPGMAIGWNNSTDQPVFNFSVYDRTVGYIAALGADVLLTVPVGDWGNGNYLPDGMPLNTTLPIGAKVGGGFLAAPGAFAAYLDAILNHTEASGEFVRYWTIGNEMPLINASVVAAYIQLFNLAAKLIHHTFPNALVGSDVMTSKIYLSTFAQDTRGVGFLSFHFYAANQVCVEGGAYCPPNGSATEPTNPQIWVNDTNFSLQHFTPPPQAVREWYDLTGVRLPDFDAELNLNSGGGVSTALNGTDPRQQQIFAAPWLVATLINAEAEDVTALEYFTLYASNVIPATVSGPFGGWGFGLTALGANSNVTYFSPFWALHLWGAYLPGGSPGLVTNSSDPYLVQAQAVRTNGGIGIALASAANTSVRVTVRIVGPTYRPVAGTLLDSTTYATPYGVSTGNISLLRDGLSPLSLNASRTHANVTIDGGGIAMIAESPYTANSSVGHNSSGNRSTSNSTGNSSENTTSSQGTHQNSTGTSRDPGVGSERPGLIARDPTTGIARTSPSPASPSLLGWWLTHAHDLEIAGAVTGGWGLALLVGVVAAGGSTTTGGYAPLRPRRRSP